MRAHIEIDEKLLDEATQAELKRLREHVALLQNELAEMRRTVNQGKAAINRADNIQSQYDKLCEKLRSIVTVIDGDARWGDE